jgi:hypothetical protein
MSKEILQRALEKTNEIEEKEVKKLKLAENIGKILGVGITVALDTTLVWLIIKFMLGFAAFTWVNALGAMFLANIIYVKLKP